MHSKEYGCCRVSRACVCVCVCVCVVFAEKTFVIVVFAKMLCSETMTSFGCLGCHQLHLNSKRQDTKRNQWKVGKTLISVILTKNASFKSYRTFPYHIMLPVCLFCSLCGYS